METKPVPSHPSLEQYRKQAKDLVKAHKSAAPEAMERVRTWHPAFASLPLEHATARSLLLSGAQLVIAREHGFESWPKFKSHIEALNFKRKSLLANDPSAVFLEAACIPMGEWHSSGTLEAAQALLAQKPEIAQANIYVAAALGDAPGVRRFLAIDPHYTTLKGGPHEWDALTYLCFSRYLRLDRSRSEGFVHAAKALLDAGASANTGWYEANDEPMPFWESAIYGAAGIARHIELTRLLLDHGADPNDGETPYHAPETYNNAVMKILVESGKLNEVSMTTLLVRKADWHDDEGIRYLLERGANPNYGTVWRYTPFQQAVRRDNGAEILQLMLDYGADPSLINGQTGRSAVVMAIHRGRGDMLRELERRGFGITLEGVDLLIAACALGDTGAVRELAAAQPALVTELLAQGGTLLAEFAGNGNTEGVELLLSLGVAVDAPYHKGDGYFEIAKHSTALHVAAWRARHDTLRLLLAHRAAVNQRDAKGHTALALAIRACVDSYWSYLRSPESVEALLSAGATLDGIETPTGYAEVDALLLSYASRVTKRS